MRGRRAAPAAAAVALALLAAAPAPARADDGAGGAGAAGTSEALPWFVGGLVALGWTSSGFGDDDAGDTEDSMLLAIEGGKLLTPWLAATFAVRLGTHGDQFHADPVHDPTLFFVGEERELGFGPRLYALAIGGRLRLGVGISKLVGQRQDNAIEFAPDQAGAAPGEVIPHLLVRSTLTTSELYVGLVPYRQGPIDLEIGATITWDILQGDQFRRTQTLGLGLRWSGSRGGTAASEPPPRASRWSFGVAGGLLTVRPSSGDDPDSDVNSLRYATLELAVRYRARPIWELELAATYGWRALVEEDPFSGDGGSGVVMNQLAVAARRVLSSPERPTQLFVAGRLGVGIPGRDALTAPALSGLRPLVGIGLGFERRIRAFAIRGELAASRMFGSFAPRDEFDDPGPGLYELSQAPGVTLLGLTLGGAYYF
jgi:hypothetical protein